MIITDDELLSELEQASKCDAVLEAEVIVTGASVKDKEFDRPANPSLCLIMDAESEMVLKCEMQKPEDDAMISMAEEIVGFILAYGAPMEIRVSNILLEAVLEQICDVCGIKLRRVKSLKAVQGFLRGMREFMAR